MGYSDLIIWNKNGDKYKYQIYSNSKIQQIGHLKLLSRLSKKFRNQIIGKIYGLFLEQGASYINCIEIEISLNKINQIKNLKKRFKGQSWVKIKVSVGV